MFGFTIPGIDGYKRLIGSWVQIISGLLMSIVQLLSGINDCIQGAAALDVCFNTLPLLFMGVIAAANGIAQLGLADKQQQIAGDQ